uniref:Uncharacterized protein n=1 Tax=Lepeophtheirus salmonis TaxID=72036 RepID=A0A0K2UE49_LEPSM
MAVERLNPRRQATKTLVCEKLKAKSMNSAHSSKYCDMSA